MDLPTYFDDFLSDTRPTDEQLREYQEGHRTLRQRMQEDEEIAAIRVGDFLQGSYRRATAIKPEGGQKSDVDIVVVTNLPDTTDTTVVWETFERFLNRHQDYAGRFERKTHSIGITLEHIEMDLVITAAPSEAVARAIAAEANRTGETVTKSYTPELFGLSALDDLSVFRDAASGDWRHEPLRIPDFDDGSWGDTDPLTQIAWTSQHNAACNGHYVNVVKALKWWRRTKCPTPKHPKGYPVEHLIGNYCPSGITSVAAGVVTTLEGIRDCPNLAYARLTNSTPTLPDRGIASHNVWGRIEPEDFATFMDQVETAAIIAREAFDIDEDVAASARRWHDLFADPFRCPEAGDDNGTAKGGFEAPLAPATPRHGRFG